MQNDLFDVGADFCTPVVDGRSTRRCASSRSTSTGSRPGATSYNEGLPALRSFILNGGTPGAALLHVARTVVRRAERSAWAAHEVHGESMNVLAITYLNRLSDLLFILARHANREQRRRALGARRRARLASLWMSDPQCPRLLAR